MEARRDTDVCLCLFFFSLCSFPVLFLCVFLVFSFSHIFYFLI